MTSGSSLASGTVAAVLCALLVSTTPWEARAVVAESGAAHGRNGGGEAGPIGSPAGSGGGTGPSNAGNYGGGTPIKVDGRTGSVSMQAQLVKLGGIVKDVGVSVSLTYELENAINNSLANMKSFGLPYGWSFNFSYMSNNGLYTSFNVDASQSYNVDSGWQTLFTPKGGGQLPIKTGFLQYNQATANLQVDEGSVTVGGIPSAYVLANLDGSTRYVSLNGLSLMERDRFGNEIQHFYERDTDPQDAQIQSIVDSWGNSIVFSYCDEGGSGCEPGQVTLTLPDGRTVGYVVVDDYRISKIIDAEGKVTHLSWSDSPCAVGESVLSGVTSPSGGFTTTLYTCMDICTQPSETSCLEEELFTTWPVAQTMYHCPTNGSGEVCPDGSSGDFLTMTYSFGTPENPNNYTGFPRYSPYAPADPFADSLMSSNNSAFTYETLLTRLEANGLAVYEIANEYNYLHLMTGTTISVRAQNADSSFGMQLAKVKAYCYDLPGSDETGCPLQANYQSLPANYQLASAVGSCVYQVGPNASGQARHSVVTRQYDSFSKAVNVRRYHGTTESGGITSNCDRGALLAPSSLKLVVDDYMEFDTPSTVDGGYLNLGYDSGHYGLLTGHLQFSYLDQDESGTHGELGEQEGPVLVTLTCRMLTTDSDAVPAGTAIMRETIGLLPNDTAAPETPGIVSACTAPPRGMRAWRRRRGLHSAMRPTAGSCRA